ncbi:MAG: hypothetical protein ACRYFU_11565 [Janthinobacterium lividum]
MKIVLDEGVPEPLIGYLPEHEVDSVGSLGWKGTKNGKLLKLIESIQAEAFITADKNLEKQQNLLNRPFATLLLSTNAWPLIRGHVEAIRLALQGPEGGVISLVDCGTFVPKRFR